ncbi:type II 3-dehydroquinate dehydratase [Rhodohalobacter mucosus]|uniref:3-dehydroquinate dehydratase n=1 Tax=Rhodohalobacter mucosus TaxID=2079485 RepID=A0A316U3W1_9BACT|nr:type II 3-dehydroquinate dehydratase [Rhodohalobacter mucosus]PWN08196.1 3-dehydroquinate dehydratase [Rhodohalobacter mucosus]
MKFLILNGPNLNLLGERDPSVYGANRLSDIENLIRQTFPDHVFRFVQSNHEGELIDAIQSAKNGSVDALIANWGGFTHSSVAIHDALELLQIPKVEVHLSNIHAREEFRERSLTGKAMHGIITGFGPDSYLLGIDAALKMLNRK